MKQLRVQTFFAALILCLSVPAFPQASQSDSQTLQAILSELRAIHNDVRWTAISQILLTELQTQQGVVSAATERVNSERLQLSNLQEEEKRESGDLVKLQDKLSDETDSVQKTLLSEAINRLKSVIPDLKVREDGLGANLQTTEGQLRSAQETLDDIQQRLDATVKKLQPIADHR